MAVRLTCLSCRAIFDAPSANVGPICHCPTCGAPVVMPNSDEPALSGDGSPPASVRLSDLAGTVRTVDAPRHPAVLVTIVGGVFLILIVGAAALVGVSIHRMPAAHFQPPISNTLAQPVDVAAEPLGARLDAPTTTPTSEPAATQAVRPGRDEVAFADVVADPAILEAARRVEAQRAREQAEILAEAKAKHEKEIKKIDDANQKKLKDAVKKLQKELQQQQNDIDRKKRDAQREVDRKAKELARKQEQERQQKLAKEKQRTRKEKEKDES